MSLVGMGQNSSFLYIPQKEQNKKKEVNGKSQGLCPHTATHFSQSVWTMASFCALIAQSVHFKKMFALCSTWHHLTTALHIYADMTHKRGIMRFLMLMVKGVLWCHWWCWNMSGYLCPIFRLLVPLPCPFAHFFCRQSCVQRALMAKGAR